MQVFAYEVRRASDWAIDATLRAILDGQDALGKKLASIERKAMTTNAQLTKTLSDITAQAAKAKTEIVGKIAALEDLLKNSNLTVEAEAALADLKLEVTGLDELNADAVVVDPPIDPPVDPPIDESDPNAAFPKP